MNRSFSKIRHIQEANQRLERRTLKEQEEVGLDLDPSIEEFNEKMVLVNGGSEDVVNKVLMSLPKGVRFLSLINCDGADFSNVDICGFPKLYYVNLKNTPNNFEEVVDCDYQMLGSSVYDLTDKNKYEF